jgi:hypothetical protein
MIRFLPSVHGTLAALFLSACGGDAPPAAHVQAANAPPTAAAGGDAAGHPSVVAASAGSPAASRANEILGTIQATMDGQAMTWIVVSGTVEGRPYASAVWMGEEPGERQIAAGGFDTMDPPLHTFRRSPGGMFSSFGDYQGSVMSLFITEAAGSAPMTLTFPAAEGDGGVYFQRRADLDDVMNTTFWLTEGTLEVSAFAIYGDLARVEGTFSGTFRSEGTGETIRVTEGRFDVTDIPGVGQLGG